MSQAPCSKEAHIVRLVCNHFVGFLREVVHFHDEYPPKLPSGNADIKLSIQFRCMPIQTASLGSTTQARSGLKLLEIRKISPPQPPYYYLLRED